MDLGLRGKTALVAAASTGLGKAVAIALAQEGANVSMFSRDEAAIRAAAEDVRKAIEGADNVLALTGDVTNPSEIQSVVDQTRERFGPIDVLYANAGGPKPGYFDDLSDDDWRRAFELNLLSTVRLTRACLPSMRERRWGRILVGTSSSVKQPIDNLMLSNSIRSGVTAWAKTLSDQVASDGVTVNCIAPGRIKTERIVQLDNDAAQRQGRTFDDITRERLAAIPMGRYGDPAEFGAVAAFLASEPARYVTGITMLVDGGQFRGTY